MWSPPVQPYTFWRRLSWLKATSKRSLIEVSGYLFCIHNKVCKWLIHTLWRSSVIPFTACRSSTVLGLLCRPSNWSLSCAEATCRLSELEGRQRMIKAFRGVAKQAVSRDELFGAIQHTLPTQCRHRQTFTMGSSSSRMSNEATRCVVMQMTSYYNSLCSLHVEEIKQVVGTLTWVWGLRAGHKASLQALQRWMLQLLRVLKMSE